MSCHIMDFGVKGLENVQSKRCVNAQAFSFRIEIGQNKEVKLQWQLGVRTLMEPYYPPGTLIWTM